MKEKILSMLLMQDSLQNRIDPDWKGKEHPWYRACHMESTELIDHVGWKWWKYVPEADIEQIHLELVDIFHFIMCHYLQIQPIKLNTEMLHGFFKAGDCVPYLDKESKIRAIENMTAQTLHHRLPQMDMFVSVCGMFGLSFHRLYQIYICKNVLNDFRQENGYQSGSYVKDWALPGDDGMEDNIYLAEISQNINFDSPDIRKIISQALTTRYNHVVGNRETGVIE